MSYIKFDKTQLINLEYSLSKELIRSNRAGGYACTTLISCNTRKYHGLLICPIDKLDNGTHVLLSSLDETVIQHDTAFNLAIHKYPGRYEPKGHKYIRDFETEPNISVIYRVGGVVLRKEMVLITGKEQILIKYTLLEANSPTKIQFRPFLAFRNIHGLSKANFDVNHKFQNANNGISMKLYDGYPNVYMQFSKSVEYIHNPNWYKDIEYIEEYKRGYEYREDLFVPGYFELSIERGESIVFSAATFEAVSSELKQQADYEMSKRIARDNYENCLVNSARQFIVSKNDKKEIVAGFPWYLSITRDTFMSLPGLTLSLSDFKNFLAITNSLVLKMKGPLFQNEIINGKPSYLSADTSLWFIWSLQKYCEQTNQYNNVWAEYGKQIKSIINGYKNGIPEIGLEMHDNGLIWQDMPNVALTWMNAYVEGKPVTPRYGYTVEINALWYNSVLFALSLAKLNNDNDFIADISELPSKISESFINMFWSCEKGYLADFINENGPNWELRPNQIIATSLFYTAIEDEHIRKSILDKIEQELLTPKGIRSLSPKSPDYEGVYEGDEKSREAAMHQGTAWPWLLGHYSESYLKIHGKSGVNFINKLFKNFEEDISEHGIGAISELYDGDPPHRPGGALSMAKSVAEIIRMKVLIDEYS